MVWITNPIYLCSTCLSEHVEQRGPKGLGRGFGLTSFAIIHIPAEER